MLTGKEYIRYSRQIMLNEHGEPGQEALKNAHVVIVGLGGLGCPAAQYLAGAGVGHLTLVDDDLVEVTNLHRQILFTDQQIGQPKVEAAAERLAQLNPHIQIDSQCLRVSAGNIGHLITDADVILDCSDNIETRYTINQAAFEHRKALVIGAGIRHEAQVISFDFSEAEEHAESQVLAGCYQCLVPDANDESFNCATAGVLGPILGIAGSMQALSAIKFLTGNNFIHNLWQCFDGRSQNWISVQHPGAPDCKLCAAD